MSDFDESIARIGNRGTISPAGPGTPLSGFSSIAEKGFESVLVANPTANLAYYMPVRVAAPCSVLDMNLQVIVSSGNLDVGVYSWAGTRLVSSGSTAVGAAGMQKVGLTDTSLGPGWHFLAIAIDNTSAIFRAADITAPNLRMCGFRQETSAFPLPATATFAALSTGTAPALTANIVSAA